MAGDEIVQLGCYTNGAKLRLRYFEVNLVKSDFHQSNTYHYYNHLDK